MRQRLALGIVVLLALASGGPVVEGSVGGGTGMVCHEFKGGTGTASRKLSEEQGSYTFGVLLQCNYGLRRQLRIAGAPVGLEIPEGMFRSKRGDSAEAEIGSIIIVIATDAPLLPHQLKRLARRAPRLWRPQLAAWALQRVGPSLQTPSGGVAPASSRRFWMPGRPIPATRRPETRATPLHQCVFGADWAEGPCCSPNHCLLAMPATMS